MALSVCWGSPLYDISQNIETFDSVTYLEAFDCDTVRWLYKYIDALDCMTVHWGSWLYDSTLRLLTAWHNTLRLLTVWHNMLRLSGLWHCQIFFSQVTKWLYRGCPTLVASKATVVYGNQVASHNCIWKSSPQLYIWKSSCRPQLFVEIKLQPTIVYGNQVAGHNCIWKSSCRPHLVFATLHKNEKQ